ncbi:MAG: hypothetical protein WCJ30_12700, partial [Deltaproteobacteria bacterium]
MLAAADARNEHVRALDSALRTRVVAPVPALLDGRDMRVQTRCELRGVVRRSGRIIADCGRLG